MMQPTDFRDFPHRSNFWRLDLARDRCVHIQRPVRAPAMIVSEVLSQQSPQMALVQDDHVVQAFATAFGQKTHLLKRLEEVHQE
jgi:hypothetical protein